MPVPVPVPVPVLTVQKLSLPVPMWILPPHALVQLYYPLINSTGTGTVPVPVLRSTVVLDDRIYKYSGVLTGRPCGRNVYKEVSFRGHSPWASSRPRPRMRRRAVHRSHANTAGASGILAAVARL